MFSEICSLRGIAVNLPFMRSGFHSTYSHLSVELDKEVDITSKDFDFSLTAIVSPTFKEYDGILTIVPLTVI